MHHYSIITFRWVTTHLPRLLLKSNLTSAPHLAKVGYDIFPMIEPKDTHICKVTFCVLFCIIFRTLVYLCVTYARCPTCTIDIPAQRCVTDCVGQINYFQ